jgi:hypothetical protein
MAADSHREMKEHDPVIIDIAFDPAHDHSRIVRNKNDKEK